MASLSSWFSPDIMHALGWALIHSLWQCLGVAALAAAMMALSRRPSIRYLVAVGALALMLAAPVATFFVLMKSTTPAPALPSAPPSFVSAMPATVIATLPATLNAVAVAAAPTVMGTGVVRALEDSLNRILSPSLLPWLVGSWLCGVAFLSLRLAGGFLFLEHRRRRHSIVASPRILALCQELQRQLGLDRAIRYLECDWLEAPAVIGWARPIILLPFTALTGLTDVQLRAVIAHELAHIRRFDAFVNLFQILVETLLFYHPAVWWLNKRIRTERELCCDETAVSLTGNRVEYARALALMADWRNAPFLAMAANRGSLSARILHILGRRPSGIGQRMVGLTGSVLFLTAALAAANALFGIAAPPIAQAKESLKAALSSSRATVDHMARQVLAARGSVKDSASDQASLNDPVRKTVADQTEAARNLQPEKLTPPSADLSRLPPLEGLATPTVLASITPPTPTRAQTLAAPVLLAADPATTALSDPNQARTAQRCVGPVNHVTGIVIAPRAIYLKTFRCSLGESDILITYGETGNVMNGYGLKSKGVRLNVQLADPADASKMQPGKLVTVVGQFRVERENHVDYLIATDARVEADPFGRSAPIQSNPAGAKLSANVTSNDQPVGPPATHELSVGLDQAGLSMPPATPAKLDMNSPYKIFVCGAVPNGSVTGEVTSSTTIQMPNFFCSRNGNPGGGVPDGGAPTGGGPAAGGARFSLNSGPCKNPVHAIPSLPWGRYCPNTPNTPWLTMTVQLANTVDASKMPLGKLVTLKGDFLVITQNNVSYLLVRNARVLYIDPFGRTLPSSINPEEKSASPKSSPDSQGALPSDLTASATAVASNTTPVAMPNDQPAAPAMLPADPATAPGPSGPRARTELALRCWLGLVGYKGCWKSDGCNGGAAVKTVEYLGINGAGADVYQVRYMSGLAAYVVTPDPKGTTDQYSVKATDPYWAKREISPRATPTLIYTKPGSAPAARCLRPTYDGGPSP